MTIAATLFFSLGWMLGNSNTHLQPVTQVNAVPSAAHNAPPSSADR
jgi:hypothetical protein